MNDKFKEKFVAYQRLIEYYDNFPDQPCLGEQRNIYQQRIKLFHLCIDFISHKFKDPFFRSKHRNPCAEASDLGLRVLNCLEDRECELDRADGEAKYDHHQHCPEVELVLAAFDAALSEHGQHVEGLGLVLPLPVRPDEYKFTTGREVDAVVAIFNQFVRQLREGLLAQGMYDKVKNFRRNASERQKRVIRIAQQAWERHSKILLIRLDWRYRKTYPAKLVRYRTQAQMDNQLLEIAQWRDEMVDILRESFGDDLAFFVWKLECGDIAGLHLHWLIGLNGSAYQDRINVPRQIARMWDLCIGEGRTFTFNVNALSGAAASGLRVIHYSDPELPAIVKRYADYLTKVDYMLKLRMPEKKHAFGGTKLEPTKATKRGPKRSFQSHLSEGGGS